MGQQANWLRKGCWATHDFKMHPLKKIPLILTFILLAGCLPKATAPIPNIAGRVAFSSNETGVAEIYLMNANGTGVVQLTHTAQGLASLRPYWSPNGEKIAFLLFTHEPANDPLPELFVMNADGTNQQRLIDLTIDPSGPRWSPDGQKIAFTRYGEIYLVNADGSQLVNLTPNLGANTIGSWSADSQKIAFVSNRGPENNLEIYVMQVDGTDPLRLTDNNPAITKLCPAWSPDGKTLAFLANPTGQPNFQLFVMGPDGANPRQLTYDLDISNLECPVWSPDSRQLAFISEADDVLHSNIFVISVDTLEVRPLTTTPANYQELAWSPDHQWLILSLKTDAQNNLLLLDTASAQQAVLVSNQTRYFDPQWQP